MDSANILAQPIPGQAPQTRHFVGISRWPPTDGHPLGRESMPARCRRPPPTDGLTCRHLVVTIATQPALPWSDTPTTFRSPSRQEGRLLPPIPSRRRAPPQLPLHAAPPHR